MSTVAPVLPQLERVPDEWKSRRGMAMPLALRVSLVALALFAVALAPRLLNRDLFPTSDEDSWMSRAGGFTVGLTSRQYGRTYQNGHPGVTTMWIAMLAQGQDGALRFADRVHGLRFVGLVPGYMEGLATARVGFAILGAAGVATCALLVWRLFGAWVGVVAGVLLALEPFLVANAQLVHVDGPLGTFTAVAALAAIVRWWGVGSPGYTVCAGVATGLALLSKTPAVFLLVFVPLVAVASSVRRHPHPALPHRGGGLRGRGRGVGVLAVDLVAWAATASATFLLLWPAIWERGLVDTLTRMMEFVRFTGAQPDEVGSFFAGQASGDPGPLYYPVATLYRLSPLVTIGLVALAMVAPRLAWPEMARAAWLLVYVLGFGLMMTLGAKKFDRYLLPIFPGLVALAAVGLVAAWQALSTKAVRRYGDVDGRVVNPPVILSAAKDLRTGQRGAVRGSLVPPLLACIGLALAVWPLAATYPYPLAYYNPLLGGGATAQRMVMVGNGEGLDQAARWLREQPDAGSLEIAAHSWDILAGLVPSGGEPLREGVPNSADYIVTYGRRIQMRRWGQALDRYLAANPPLYVVRINGIEYVHIHPGPKRGQRP